MSNEPNYSVLEMDKTAQDEFKISITNTLTNETYDYYMVTDKFIGITHPDIPKTFVLAANCDFKKIFNLTKKTHIKLLSGEK